jgi:hypothetical protein
VKDHALIETFDSKAETIAKRWVKLIRNEARLKHYNELSDEQLCALNTPLYSRFARSIERGIDKKTLGSHFVRLGKNCMSKGFPISEMVLANNMSQKAVIEYIRSEFVYDDPLALYQVFGLIEKVNDFFFLGCFYMIKGFLERMYETMLANDSISEDVLRTYLKDDFFFKKDTE